MGTILFYIVVCGAAWYLGGPGLAGFACLGITIWWALSRLNNAHTSRQTSLADRARHRQDGEAHLYYEQDGKTIHESESCAACGTARAEELRRQGYSVEHIPGRRNSGQL